jgi:putative ABC transport system permease protein
MWKTAFKFMIYDKTKFIGILSGIVISIFIIGAQLGMLNGIYDTALVFLKDNKEYVYVVSPKSTSSGSLVNIDKRIGNELLSIDGVEKAYPLIFSMGNVKYRSGNSATAAIIGIQGPDYAGAPKEYLPGTDLNELHNEGAVIVDAGDIENMENIKLGEYFSINENRVYVSGFSIKNPGLGQQNIVTTIERARKLSNFPINQVSAFLVKTKSNDPLVQKKIAGVIETTIPNVKARTGLAFNQESIDYMATSSGIMFGFMIMVAFALITGLIIVGLTMFTSVKDRMKDYGTIKAIGGSNSMVTKMILIQSIIYSFLGFIISMMILFGLKFLMEMANQALNFSPSIIAFLLTATLIIGIVSSYFSLRKILKLDPVEIFRM